MRLPIDPATRPRTRSDAGRCVRLFQAVVARHGSTVQAFVRGAAVESLEHYPPGDAVDRRHGFQCFYHSHRAGSLEHGHLHLFERTAAGHADPTHLLAIGLDARGLPVSLFTVNHWVTGGEWRDARATIEALHCARFDAAPGHALVGRWLRAFVRLYLPVVERLLMRRDALLRRRGGGRLGERVRNDRSLEVVSRSRIDWIGDLQRLEAR